MHVELVTTPAGRETVEINFGGRIEALTYDDARKMVQWINELLPGCTVPECEWREDVSEYGNVWETACGQTYIFEDGAPSDNGAKFCSYCGRVLREKRDIEPPMEDEPFSEGELSNDELDDEPEL